MKILLITEFFPSKGKYFSGGVEARTFFIAQKLVKHHQLTIISRRKRGEKKIETNFNLKIIRLGKETNEVEASFFSIFPRFLFLIDSFIQGLKQDFDLVEGSNFICLLPAYFVGFFKKKPAIAWYPDIYGEEWIKNFGFFTGLTGKIIEKIGLILPWNKIIALSNQTKLKLTKEGIQERKISVIYGGVDLEFIKKIKVKKYRNPTICCISRLVRYKNVDCLIRAIQLIKLDLPKIRVIIVGKGPEKKKLIKLSQKLKVEENIDFRENLSYQNLIRTLKASHLFCLPSMIEGFGLTTIEAIASGIPFVISDIPINREVTQGRGGLFFKANNHYDLVRKILEIFKKNNSAIFTRQKRALLAFYDWDRISSQTEKIYKRNLITKSL